MCGHGGLEGFHGQEAADLPSGPWRVEVGKLVGEMPLGTGLQSNASASHWRGLAGHFPGLAEG